MTASFPSSNNQKANVTINPEKTNENEIYKIKNGIIRVMINIITDEYPPNDFINSSLYKRAQMRVIIKLTITDIEPKIIKSDSLCSDSI